MKTMLLLLALAAYSFFCGFFCGEKIEHDRMQVQVDEAVKWSVNREQVAKQWERRYDELYPLLRQWRMGYEQLQARCKQ